MFLSVLREKSQSYVACNAVSVFSIFSCFRVMIAVNMFFLKWKVFCTKSMRKSVFKKNFTANWIGDFANEVKVRIIPDVEVSKKQPKKMTVIAIRMLRWPPMLCCKTNNQSISFSTYLTDWLFALQHNIGGQAKFGVGKVSCIFNTIPF